MCSGCGETVKKDLSERIHSCPFCELTLDRDHNAALNIKALGLSVLEDMLFMSDESKAFFSRDNSL
jgi:putative transposase